MLKKVSWASEIINFFPVDLSSTPDEVLRKEISCLILVLAAGIINDQTNHRMDHKKEMDTELFGGFEEELDLKLHALGSFKANSNMER